jgi:hypothetical protein
LHERRGAELRTEAEIADYIPPTFSGMAISASGIAGAAGLRAAALRFAGRLARLEGAALRAGPFAFFALRFAGAARRAEAPRFFAALRFVFVLTADFFFVFRAMLVSSREHIHCAPSRNAASTFNAERHQIVARLTSLQ